jgi:hypothetical protein
MSDDTIEKAGDCLPEAKFRESAGSSEEVLQRYFDFSTQLKVLEKALEELKPGVIALLKKESPRIVDGGVLQLSWRASTEYSKEVFDLLDIEQIKSCAKVMMGEVKKSGLTEEIQDFLIKKPDVPVISCIKNVNGGEADGV